MTHWIDCPDCEGKGFNYRAIRFYGGGGELTEEVCQTCEGDGGYEDELRCLYCEAALDARGYCASCEDSGLPDSAVKPIGGGRWQVAA